MDNYAHILQCKKLVGSDFKCETGRTTIDRTHHNHRKTETPMEWRRKDYETDALSG